MEEINFDALHDDFEEVAKKFVHEHDKLVDMLMDVVYTHMGLTTEDSEKPRYGTRLISSGPQGDTYMITGIKRDIMTGQYIVDEEVEERIKKIREEIRDRENNG